MVQRRRLVPHIGVLITDAGLVAVSGLDGAGVLEEASVREPVGLPATGEALVGEGLINHGEDGNVNRLNKLREEVFLMPGLDGTGPRGEGPMTGGARGYCNPGYAGYGPAYGRGYGMGWGRGFRGGFGPGFGWGRSYGRGFGGWYGPVYNYSYGSPYAMNPEDEVAMLKDDASAIKNELDAINKRIEELESRPSES